MRFAWLRENAGDDVTVDQNATNRLIFVTYNVVWWVPIVLPIVGVIATGTGFIAFAIITAIRACANLYRNNILSPEQGEYFPFRAP